MEAIAKTKHLKGSPRKARLVIDLIRGRNVSQALNILKFTDKRAAEPIEKTLRSAIANATYLAEKQNIAIDPDDLFVKSCFVDMGAHKNRRRMRPAPQGRAYREQRHYCHITILVSSEIEKDETKPVKKAKASVAQTDETAVKPKAKKETKPKAEKVTKAKEKTPKAEKTAIAEPIEEKVQTVETPAVVEEQAAETTETKVAEVPKAEGTVETKSEVVEETKVEAGKSEDSEAGDVLEVDSPKAEAKEKTDKQKAEASDAKNVQSQTPAERNETKKADEKQQDDNDILELQ